MQPVQPSGPVDPSIQARIRAAQANAPASILAGADAAFRGGQAEPSGPQQGPPQRSPFAPPARPYAPTPDQRTLDPSIAARQRQAALAQQAQAEQRTGPRPSSALSARAGYMDPEIVARQKQPLAQPRLAAGQKPPPLSPDQAYSRVSEWVRNNLPARQQVLSPDFLNNVIGGATEWTQDKLYGAAEAAFRKAGASNPETQANHLVDFVFNAPMAMIGVMPEIARPAGAARPLEASGRSTPETVRPFDVPGGRAVEAASPAPEIIRPTERPGGGVHIEGEPAHAGAPGRLSDVDIIQRNQTALERLQHLVSQTRDPKVVQAIKPQIAAARRAIAEAEQRQAAAERPGARPTIEESQPTSPSISRR